MNTSNLWHKAKDVSILTSDEIISGFNIGFDKQIPCEMQEELRTFVDWVENNFNVPVTLWVDFEYKHYLVSNDGHRVGYLFYWTDFRSYPVFENKDDIPEIRLPVRTEHSALDEILTSFIEAITIYFAWICNEVSQNFVPNDSDVHEVLQEYRNSRV